MFNRHIIGFIKIYPTTEKRKVGLKIKTFKSNERHLNTRHILSAIYKQWHPRLLFNYNLTNKCQHTRLQKKSYCD